MADWKWSGWDIPLGIATGGLSTAIHGGMSMSSAMAQSAGNAIADYGKTFKGLNMDDLKSLIEDERAYNSAEAQKNRDWQESMSNTATQRLVADYKAAGLNPYWVGSSAQASTPSGDSASSSSTSALASVLGNAFTNQTSLFNNFIKSFTSLVGSAMKIASTAG